MESLTDFQTKMLMESKPLSRADNRQFEYPWQVAARFNRETEQLKREANSSNIRSANIARKQLINVKHGGNDRYFTGC